VVRGAAQGGKRLQLHSKLGGASGIWRVVGVGVACILTALSNLAPAWAPYFSASFCISEPRPGSSLLILADTLWASAREKVSMLRLSGSQAVNPPVARGHWRWIRRPDWIGLRKGFKLTLSLLLCNRGVASCGVEVVTDTTSGCEAEGKGKSRSGHVD
jgi:hypothetical protein